MQRLYSIYWLQLYANVIIQWDAVSLWKIVMSLWFLSFFQLLELFRSILWLLRFYDMLWLYLLSCICEVRLVWRLWFSKFLILGNFLDLPPANFFVCYWFPQGCCFFVLILRTHSVIFIENLLFCRIIKTLNLLLTDVAVKILNVVSLFQFCGL